MGRITRIILIQNLTIRWETTFMMKYLLGKGQANYKKKDFVHYNSSGPSLHRAIVISYLIDRD
jgi:hypothetical protein